MNKNQHNHWNYLLSQKY